MSHPLTSQGGQQYELLVRFTDRLEVHRTWYRTFGTGVGGVPLPPQPSHRLTMHHMRTMPRRPHTRTCHLIDINSPRLSSFGEKPLTYRKNPNLRQETLTEPKGNPGCTGWLHCLAGSLYTTCRRRRIQTSCNSQIIDKKKQLKRK